MPRVLKLQLYYYISRNNRNLLTSWSLKFGSAFRFSVHLCFFIYSCKAFSNSSLILRVEPVLFTTNFIHSVQVCLSTFIDVFAFWPAPDICCIIPYAVNKVNGYYHKLNISPSGIIVRRYCGNVCHAHNVPKYLLERFL